MTGVELCSGTFDEFAEIVPNELMRLIALHADSERGGSSTAATRKRC
jgi:hypothetical protein